MATSHTMNRRTLFKSLATLGGLTAVGCAGRLSAVTPPAPSASRPRRVPFVEVADGTRLYLKDWGDGPPIVLIAPWSLHSGWWDYQMPFLAGRGFRCIAPDRRGHGRSTEPGSGYEFDTLADDLAAVFEQLDLRDVTLVGHSMGCAEVVRYLSRHGSSRVARLALIATITPFTVRTPENPGGVPREVLESARVSLAQDRGKPIADAAGAFFGTSKNTVSAATMEWWVRMMMDQCSLHAMTELHRVFTETDFRADLRALKVRTRLIHGDSDTSTPFAFTGERTAALIENCEVKLYKDAAHGLPVTHKDQLNADLLAFARSA